MQEEIETIPLEDDVNDDVECQEIDDETSFIVSPRSSRGRKTDDKAGNRDKEKRDTRKTASPLVSADFSHSGKCPTLWREIRVFIRGAVSLKSRK